MVFKKHDFFSALDNSRPRIKLEITNVHPQPICGRELSRPYGVVGGLFLFPFSGEAVRKPQIVTPESYNLKVWMNF